MKTINQAKVSIFMQPIALDEVNRIGYDWDYSNEFSTDEIEVIVDDVEYVINNGYYQDPDEQLVEHYGLNWDHVNRVEALNFCAI
tara:strand:+ start:69 stop:323 length:255 start_codon:yes stop_codon:yes gene_type:complete